MTILKAGDVRTIGDQVRRLPDPHGDTDSLLGPIYDTKDYSRWQPTDLIGHSILGADLMISEYRRP